MRRLAIRALTLVAAVPMLYTASVARADTILFGDLQNYFENPPAVPATSTGDPRPASFGTIVFVLNDAMTSMSMSATVFNIDFTGTQTPDINDNLTAAHIHAGPAVTPTTNGPVVWGFLGAPFNDNNPNDLVMTPFATGVGATITGKWDAPEGNNTTLAAQIANLLGGHAYANFHTRQFPGGEVRGNLVVVPEPGATTAALAIGVSGLAALRWRFRRRS